MTRRPPSSPLFPYTTLFRSSSPCAGASRKILTRLWTPSRPPAPGRTRSEEHTSELQSQFHLLFPRFFFNDPAPTEFSTLSLHDALPIFLAMCRSLKEDIDAVVDTVKAVGARPDDVSVLVLSTLSDLHLKYKLGKTLLRRAGQPESQWLDRPVDYYREQNLDLITDAIRYARERGFSRVEFSAEDASRSDVTYGEVWARACVKAGGTRMCFSDTCGVFTPEAVDHYIPRLVKVLGDVPMTQ